MLISPEYIKQNKALHADGNYGVSGHKYVGLIIQLSDQFKTRDILDYGCGQRFLERALCFDIRNYDPCIAGLDTDPAPADIVSCCDVLEHIEPDYLDNVLDDLQRVTLKAALFVIAQRPAMKILPDGRNAHLIQKPSEWWMPKIISRFKLKQFEDKSGFAIYVVEKL